MYFKGLPKCSAPSHLQKCDFIYCEVYLHIIFLYVDILGWGSYNISFFPLSSTVLYKICDSVIISVFIALSFSQDANIYMVGLEVNKTQKTIFYHVNMDLSM
jgi:hypothetical protein